MCGARRASQNRQEWARSAELKSAESGKTHDVDVMKRHIKDVLSKLVRAVRLSCSGKVTSQKFMQYGRRKQAILAICRLIVEGGVDQTDPRPVVVALGAGSFSPSFGKGHFPGPVKAVRTALLRNGCKVIDVDEYNTSKLCCACNKELIPMRGRDGGDVYAVRRCLHVDCLRMTFDRDTNAALNILNVSQHIEREGCRPAAFAR
jgi:hypothetical protein